VALAPTVMRVVAAAAVDQDLVIPHDRERRGVDAAVIAGTDGPQRDQRATKVHELPLDRIRAPRQLALNCVRCFSAL
jgi:hypothetical protein